MTKRIRNAICITAMALIFAIVLAANIVCAVFDEVITGYLYGSGITYDSEAQQKALAFSDTLCREMTEEGVVLLKNEPLGNGKKALPLDGVDKVNIFGWAGSKAGWIFGSDGSVNSNSGSSKLKTKALTDVLSDVGIEYNTELTDMYAAFRNQRADGRALSLKQQFYMLIEPAVSAYNAETSTGKSILQNAKDYSDTALVVLGRMGGEGTDLPFVQYKNTTGNYSMNSSDMPVDRTRHYLQTSTEEDELLEMVMSNFDNVIVIINTCNAMELGFLDDERIDGAISVNGTGQSGAYSVAKVLKGEVNPSGRLTNTQPYDMKDDPSYVNAGGQTANSGYVVYAEDIYVGYKWYETADAEGYWQDRMRGDNTGYDAVVQYPFGYGLSYTDFEWKIEEVKPAPDSVITADTEITVKVRVTNKGSVAGMDVVQLYYTPPYYAGGIEKSAVNLVAFAKTTELKPASLTDDGIAESQVLTLSFTPHDMASYDCYDKNTNRFVGYELERGEYGISVRTDAHTVAACEGASFVYDVEKTIRFATDPVTGERVTNRFTTYSMIAKQEDGTFAEQEIKAYGDCSIDGSDADQADVVYLSRRDFANTFPKTSAVKRTGNLVTSSATYRYTGYDDKDMPNQGNSSGDKLYLYVTESDGKPSAAQLKTGEGIKINSELMLALGADYDDPQWEQLLDQMSADDLSKLIELGGYRTHLIESIGKKYLLENDGPAGLNRHIMENDKNEDITLDRSGWTTFPMPSLIAASFNPSLAYAFGLSVANEGIATGVTGWYAPGANLQRSPFGGRNSEYYSEDALLSGIMAAETARGAIANGMNVYIKHFAVNETETHRTGLSTWLTEQALRELYLRPFEIAVKRGGANGMMSTFNRLGNTWTGANHALMTEVLRDEWGFRGAVVTDYYDGGLMHLERGLLGGNDLWLTGTGNKAGGFKSNDKAFMYAARIAAHNILYAHCNSYYVSQTHDKSQDVVTADINRIQVVEPPFPAWVFAIVALDLVAVAGIVVWTLYIFRPDLFKRKKSAAEMSSDESVGSAEADNGDIKGGENDEG